MTKISQGVSRQEIEQFFRNTASNASNQDNTSKEDFVKKYIKDIENKKILFVIPDTISELFSVTSFFKSCKKIYQDYDIYVSSIEDNLKILTANPHIKGTIPFINEMRNNLWLEGYLSEDKLFDIVFQMDSGLFEKNYLHNDEDIINLCTRSINSH